MGIKALHPPGVSDWNQVAPMCKEHGSCSLFIGYHGTPRYCLPG